MASPAAERLRQQFLANLRPDDLSVEDARRNWETETRETHVLPEGTEIVPVVADGVQSLWVRAPDVADNGKVILHLHGGGYIAGSPFIYRRFAAHTSKAARLPVLLPDYALAPEHPYPAGVEDAFRAYRYLLAEGHAPESIALMGDSAGGGLALSLLLLLRERHEPMPGAVALVSPWTDLTVSSPSYTALAALDPIISQVRLRASGRRYAGDRDPADPMLSPLFADLAGLPAMLIQVGAHERMLDDSVLFAERARAAGSEVTLEVWPEMWHVFHQHCPDLPEGWDGIVALTDYLRARLR